MERRKKNVTDSGTSKESTGKKTPAIIELADEDLELVVGAGRCPPTATSSIKHTIDE